jgi:CRP-like cAMP-binding protein
LPKCASGQTAIEALLQRFDKMAIGDTDRGTANYLLQALPQAVFERVRGHLELVPLTRREVIYRADSPVDHLYFVDRGLISLVKTMRDGRTVEIGVIGIEGLSGSNALFGIDAAVLESIVQVPGSAWRIRQSILRREIGESIELRDLLMRYAYFAINQFAQTAACNRLHSLEARCCRWLLMAHDNAREDSFSLTHEFLAMMLGVQRSGVSLTASILQRAGLIRYARGRVTIADRAGLEATACECYATMREDMDRIFRVSGAL